MISLYLLLVLFGLGLSHVLYRRRARTTPIALIGTLLALAAVLTGFSIGFFLAPAAVIVLLVAAFGLRSGDRVT